MPREKFANSIATTLNGSINNSVTSVVVTDGSTFPTDSFRVVCESEIMYCTSRSSNTLTVIRGQEGTTGASHANSTPINHVVTKGSLDGFRLNMFADLGIVPFNTSLSVDDDEFDDESFSGWTSVQGTPTMTVVETNHACNITIPTGSAGQQHYAILKNKTPGVGDWIQMGYRQFLMSNQFPMIGPMMADGSTYGAGNQVHFAYSTHENDYFLRNLTNFNSNGGQNIVAAFSYDWSGIRHMKMTYLGSNSYTCTASGDGINWVPVFTASSRGSMTPTWCGVGVTSWGSTNSDVWSISYCRFSF